MKQRLFYFLLTVFLSYSLVAQKNGQLTARIYTYLGEQNDSQMTGYLFKDWASDEEVLFGYNDFLDLPGANHGFDLGGLSKYKNKELIIDFVYLKRLCSEGAESYISSGWVAYGIKSCNECSQSIASHQNNKQVKFPRIGYFEDPDGYVNVRSQMNVQSPVVSTLDFYEGEYFYFFDCPDKNWYLYYGYNYKGYVHASRVRLIN